MKNLEINAKTVEEAIQQALDQLGVTREEVEVTVLNEGKSGFMGRGAEEAKIRVEPLVSESKEWSDVAETARDVLETLLTAMGVTASVVPRSEPIGEGGEGAPAPVAFDVEGDDLGILIGRRGQTIACLQHIVRLIMAHQMQARVPIIIDVEGYKQHRYESLQALAGRMAEQVTIEKLSLAVEPMSAYERRIIHIALADHPDVITESAGIGEARKVVILPKEE